MREVQDDEPLKDENLRANARFYYTNCTQEVEFHTQMFELGKRGKKFVSPVTWGP